MAEKRREDMLHVGSQVWVTYLLDTPIRATITKIIVWSDGRLYAMCADRSGDERCYALDELASTAEGSGGDGA